MNANSPLCVSGELGQGYENKSSFTAKLNVLKFTGSNSSYTSKERILSSGDAENSIRKKQKRSAKTKDNIRPFGALEDNAEMN